MILDIRTPPEYAQGHVAGAVLVPTSLPPLSRAQLDTLRAQLEQVTQGHRADVPVGVYCKKGKRAALAVHMLQQLGFDARNLGGVEQQPLPGLVQSGQLRWTV